MPSFPICLEMESLSSLILTENCKVFSFFFPWPPESSSTPPEICSILSFSSLHDFHWLKGCVDMHLILSSNDNHFTPYRVFKKGLISLKTCMCVNYGSCIAPVTHRVKSSWAAMAKVPLVSLPFQLGWLSHTENSCQTTRIKWCCHRNYNLWLY